jgi:hypothetical protein
MSLLDKVSLVVTPNAVKANKLYAVIPADGAGDLTAIRSTTKTRTNGVGLIETVAVNVPSLNYDTVGGEPSILIEPQRTNLLTYSQDYSNSSWNKALGSTLESSTITSPSGQDNAFLIDMTASGTFISKAVTFTAVPHSYSLFLKSPTVNGTYVINYFDGDHHRVLINLTTVWQRFELNFTPNAVNGFVYLGDPRSLSPTLKTAHVWGAQLEESNYSTSYIPTLGSSVTRNQDLISKTGISDLINSQEGVLFLEMAALVNDLNIRTITLSNGTSSTRVLIAYSGSSNAIYFNININGTSAFAYQNASYDITKNLKIAFSYKLNQFKIFINGVKVHENLLGNVPNANALNSLALDNGGGLAPYFGKISQLQLYKTALTDDECILLTSNSYASFELMAADLNYVIQ